MNMIIIALRNSDKLRFGSFKIQMNSQGMNTGFDYK